MKIILLLSFYLLFLASFLFAQKSKIDSLENALQTAKDDTTKINLLIAVSAELIHSGDFEQAMQFANDALTISDKILSDNNNQSEIKIKKANACNNIAVAHMSKGNYDKALDYNFRTLKIREEIGDKKGIAYSYSNIGVIHKKKHDYDKALEFYFKALKIREEVADEKGMASTYGNIAIVYDEINEFDKSLEFHFKALKLADKIGDKKLIGNSFNNIGNVHLDKGDNDKALEYYLKASRIYEEIGDKNGLSVFYGNIGELNISLKNFTEARNYFKKSLQYSKEIGAKEWMKNAYKSLSKTESMLGNWKSAYEYHKEYSEVKDSIFNEESNKQIAEMQTKYETEKKEQQIKLLNKDKEIQDKDLQRQKTIRNAVAGGLMLVLLFSFVLINRLLLIRKQKKLIEIEREKSEKLLLNILPKDTAEELKQNNKVVPRHYEMVTVMFTDFKGFTTIAEKMSAEELVSELDFIFKKFDEIISKYPIEKIKTIGDAYMCAGGVPVANTTNPIDVVLAALDIQAFMQAQNKWQLRIGIHTGSVIAGVVGDKKFAYDIWGDAVNTASRMESSGEPNKVNISGMTYQFLKDNQELKFTLRGKIPAKNKGEIEMYFVDRMS